MTGFNEVALGIPVPYLADMILRQVVGDRAATDLLFSGKLIPVEKAHELGLVDKVLEEDLLEDEAIYLWQTVEDAFEAYKQQGDAGAAARTTTAAAAGGD